jgi:hypothetical protein
VDGPLLARHEAHRWPAHRLAQRLGIRRIVLAALAMRPTEGSMTRSRRSLRERVAGTESCSRDSIRNWCVTTWSICACRSGIYVVGWFDRTSWDPADIGVMGCREFRSQSPKAALTVRPQRLPVGFRYGLLFSTYGHRVHNAASSTLEMDKGLFGRGGHHHLRRCLVPVSSSGSTGQRPSSRPDLHTLRRRAQ